MSFLSTNAQKKYLEIFPKNKEDQYLISSLQYKDSYSSLDSIDVAIKNIENQLSKKGFLNYELRSTQKNDSLTQVTIYFKDQLKTARIYYNHEILPKEAFFPFKKSISSISNDYIELAFQELDHFLKTFLDSFVEKGFVFAKLQLKNISVTSQLLEAQLVITNLSERRLNDIKIRSTTKLPERYIKKHINFSKGQLFSEQQTQKVSRALGTITFLKELKAPEVLFTNDSTILYLYLDKKPANQFDGLIGFNSNENGKGLSLTGYIDITLHNVLNSGELFALNWKNNSGNTQSFQFKTSLPYLFNTKNTLGADIKIFKQDSSFTTSSLRFSLRRNFNYRSSAGIQLKSDNSVALSESEHTAYIDYQSNFIGVVYTHQINSEHFFNENKLLVHLEALIGSRFANHTKTGQSAISFSGSYLLNLNNNHYIQIKNHSSKLFSKANLYDNEFTRLGGYQSIRGFLEESLQSSEFTYFNLEYRKKINDSSYLYSITDVGFLKDYNTNTITKPYAFGLGYRFNAGFGTIDIGYAIANFAKNSFSFSNSIFHLKLINTF